MSNAATHRGTCQLCGHLQKLPGGHLSIHGYHKRWGYFSGKCPGSRHAPYEVSAALIQHHLERVREEAERLELEAREVLESATHVWLHEYVKGSANRRGGSVYLWHRIEVAAATVNGISVSWLDAQGKRHEMQHGVYGAPWVRVCNERRAKTLRKDAAEHAQYATWLAERVSTWAPAPLLAIA